ncbi:glycosyltransferase family 4 protein [Halomonas sp. G11]|uniref:glycosyltransferase family 4 protein n=1 Tax=Halomonas sp. G11 TaxID=1684425 RepID=UPI0008011A68|nr:glycosyltransferase family 4 protein [Halomonas sp. G11]OBA00460.1 glycosyl transferase family 1 [Halomonas sp. G11]
MKVLLLSRYGVLGASSRVRFLQYLPYFYSQGLEITIKPLLSDTYLQNLYNGGSRWREVLKGYTTRIFALLSARRFDVIIIEKELFPFMPAIAERFLRLIGVSYIVDYDDALFHRYDCHSNPWIRRLLGKKIDSVMRQASCVIAGNNYLAERARRVGARRVEIIPTVVDAERYHPKQKSGIKMPIIGWIGTPQTSRYLQPLLPVLESIKSEVPLRFVAIGANPEDFEGTLVETWPWSEDTEVESLQQFDVGVMPLMDSPWERGKCGYKLIQYMACGVPVVASPVGVNVEIVKPGENGLLASSIEEWGHALRQLLQEEPSMRKQMGAAGHALVKDRYSLQAQAPKLLKIIYEAA